MIIKLFYNRRNKPFKYLSNVKFLCDQMPHSVVSDLGLHCLLSPVCPNT